MFVPPMTIQRTLNGLTEALVILVPRAALDVSMMLVVSTPGTSAQSSNLLEDCSSAKLVNAPFPSRMYSKFLMF
jgi:hypothetical protein